MANNGEATVTDVDRKEIDLSYSIPSCLNQRSPLLEYIPTPETELPNNVSDI